MTKDTGQGRNHSTGFSVLAAVLISLSFLCSSFSISTCVTADVESRQEAGIWVSTKMWSDTELIYDAEVGDVWPGHEGNEVVVCGESNWVTMVHGHEDTWESVPLFKEDWYATNVAIGDADADEPGNEIVNVGWHGNVSMIYWEDAKSKWTREVLVRGLDAGLDWGYGVAIGDFDPRYEGNEIAMTEDLGKLAIIRKDGSDWVHEVIWQEGGAGILDPYLDTVLLADFDPEHDGDEILVAGGSKWVTELYYNGSDEWAIKRLYRDRLAPVQVSVGDIVEGTPGNEIAVVGLSNNLTVLEWNGSGWDPTTVFTDSDVIYDVEIGTLLPGGANQVVTGGWSANITLHEGAVTGDQTSTVVHQGKDFIFGVTVGDFDDLHSGNEVVLTDGSGLITKLQYETPDFVLYSPGPEVSTSAGSDAGFDIMVYSRGGFKDKVTLTAKTLPQGWSASFSPSAVTPTGYSSLKVSVPPDTTPVLDKVVVEGVSGSKVHTLELRVKVLPPGEKDFALSALPQSQSVIADYSVKYTIVSSSMNGFSDSIALSVLGLPDGVTAEFSAPSMVPSGSVTMEVRTMSTSPKGAHYLMISAEGGGKVHVVTVVLTIKDASSPDFSIGLAPSTIEAVGSVSTQVDVNVLSQFGFSDQVTLSVHGTKDGMMAEFDPDTVVPTGTSVMNLTVEATVPGGTYYIEVRGESGGTVHAAALRIELNKQGNPDFSVVLSPGSGSVTASGSSYFNVTISPKNGFGGQVVLSANGLPPDGAAIFTPEEISPAENAVMEIKTLLSTPEGSYTVSVEGAGSGLHRSTPIAIEVLAAKPLVSLTKLDMPKEGLKDGKKAKFQVWVENLGQVNATDVELELSIDDKVVKSKKVDITAGSGAIVDLTWTAQEGEHNLTVTIVDTGDIDIEDGTITRTVKVGASSFVGSNLIIWVVIIIVFVVLAVVALGYLIGTSGGHVEHDEEERTDVKKKEGRPDGKRKKDIPKKKKGKSR
jgi:uncharacterized membrane protein